MSKMNLYIIASTMDGVGLEIETFRDPKTTLKRLGALVDAPFPKPTADQTPEEYHAAYLQWVREENDNICQNDIALLVEQIGQAPYVTSQPAKPAAVKPPAEDLQDLDDEEKQLLQALKLWRKDKANERNIAEHLILLNSTLLGIVKAKPTTMDALKPINGVGDIKRKALGEDITAIVRAFY